MALGLNDLAILTARFGCARFGASRFGFIPCPEDVKGPGFDEPGEYIYRETNPPSQDVPTAWTLQNEDCACRDLCTLALGAAEISPTCQAPDIALTFTWVLSGVLGLVEGIARVSWGDHQYDEQKFDTLENGDIVFSHTYSASGTYTVRLRVWDERGCNVSASDTVEIATPLAITASADNITSGAGSQVTFGSVVTGGVGPYTYLWNFQSKPYLGKVPTTSYWSLDEDAAADRVDTVGGHDLTAHNSPTAVTGAFGGMGNNFNEPTDQWLSTAHHADLQGGDVDLSVAGWLRLDGPTNDQYAVVGVADEWKVFVSGFGSYTNYLRFGWWKDDATFIATPVASAQLNGRPLAFFHAWRDSGAQTINIRIEDEALGSAASTGGGQLGALEFQIGALDSGGGTPAKQFDGILDEIYLYRGLWSDEEVLNLRGESALAEPTWQFTDGGAYDVTVTVTDSRGCTATDTIAITASEFAPFFTWDQPAESGTVTFTLDDDGLDVLSYDVDYGEGAGWQLDVGSPIPNNAYPGFPDPDATYHVMVRWNAVEGTFVSEADMMTNWAAGQSGSSA